METMTDFFVGGGAPKPLQTVTAAMKLKQVCSLKSYDQPRQHIEKQRHYLVKVRLVKAMVIPVVKYRCESWTIKKAER